MKSHSMIRGNAKSKNVARLTGNYFSARLCDSSFSKSILEKFSKILFGLRKFLTLRPHQSCRQLGEDACRACLVQSDNARVSDEASANSVCCELDVYQKSGSAPRSRGEKVLCGRV